MIGAIYRARTAARRAYNAEWKRAEDEYNRACREARRARDARMDEVQRTYDEDYPLDCVGCQGSTRPECEGCEMFVGVKS